MSSTSRATYTAPVSDSTTDSSPDEPVQPGEPVNVTKKVDFTKKAATGSADDRDPAADGDSPSADAAPVMPITIKVAIGAMIVELIAGLLQALTLRGSTAELTKYLVYTNSKAKKPKNPYTASDIVNDLHSLRTSALVVAALSAVVLLMIIYMMRRPRSASASRWAVLVIAVLGQVIPGDLIPVKYYPSLANELRLVAGVACVVSIAAIFFFPKSTEYFRACRRFANPGAAQRPSLFGPRPAAGAGTGAARAAGCSGRVRHRPAGAPARRPAPARLIRATPRGPSSGPRFAPTRPPRWPRAPSWPAAGPRRPVSLVVPTSDRPLRMPTALVTGATAGLGAEIARQLAGDGHDLVIVARDHDRLAATADDLRQRFGVDVDVLAADLSTEPGCDLVASRLADELRPIEVLVNNAGVGMYRRFGVGELADEQHQLDLNVRAVLRLSHAAVRAMTRRGRGQIINISSVAGFVPRGGNATYSASKAWVTMFSQGLAVQLRQSGVTVTAICPGFTRTEFHQRAEADMSHVPERLWLDASTVAREGLADAAAGKVLSVPGRQYKALVTAARLIPPPLLRAIMARRGL